MALSFWHILILFGTTTVFWGSANHLEVLITNHICSYNIMVKALQNNGSMSPICRLFFIWMSVAYHHRVWIKILFLINNTYRSTHFRQFWPLQCSLQRLWSWTSMSYWTRLTSPKTSIQSIVSMVFAPRAASFRRYGTEQDFCKGCDIRREWTMNRITSVPSIRWLNHSTSATSTTSMETALHRPIGQLSHTQPGRHLELCGVLRTTSLTMASGWFHMMSLEIKILRWLHSMPISPGQVGLVHVTARCFSLWCYRQ